MDKEKISYFASGFLALGLVPMTAVIVPLYALGIGAGPAEVGIIMAMRSLLPFLLAIPGGAMVDRYGVRFVVTRLAFACAVLSLVYPFTTSVFHLVLLQLVFGVCQSFCWIGVQTGIVVFGVWEGPFLDRSSLVSSGITSAQIRALLQPLFGVGY